MNTDDLEEREINWEAFLDDKDRAALKGLRDKLSDLQECLGVVQRELRDKGTARCLELRERALYAELKSKYGD